ncbi:MAG: glycosyltransferase [Rhodobacteraceae bacterium]|nr:glycosyltransferase [Paracoccaceae bacterium]
MKIAYILNTYPQPSHSFIRREMRALEKAGVTVVRLAMRRTGMPLVDPGDLKEAQLTSYVLDRGAVGLFGAMVRQALRRPGGCWRAFRLAWHCGRISPHGMLRHLIYLAEAAEVVRRCRADGVDHLHAHFGTNAATVAMLAGVLGGPGYSFTVHGPEEFDAPVALSLGLKLDRAAFAVGVSQFGRSQLMRWAGFETWPRLKVVHCAIEPEAFKAAGPMPKGPLRLVSIGRFAEQKGQMILIRMMQALKKQHPDIHLTLVGDGEMRSDLEAEISRFGLESSVTLTGWLDEDGVRREIANAHALIMPSFAEGLPMVVMEAMALARPVIATYIAGIPELVQPGITGWLVPAGDVDALVKAVQELAQSAPEALTRMGQAGRVRVLSRHDADIEAGKLVGHFQAAIDVS